MMAYDRWTEYDNLVAGLSLEQLQEALKREARLRHAYQTRWEVLAPVIVNTIYNLHDGADPKKIADQLEGLTAGAVLGTPVDGESV